MWASFAKVPKDVASKSPENRCFQLPQCDPTPIPLKFWGVCIMSPAEMCSPWTRLPSCGREVKDPKLIIRVITFELV